MATQYRSKHSCRRSNPKFQPLLFWYRLGLVVIILALWLATGCGAMNQRVQLPPLADSETGKVKDGHFVWIDLLTEDPVSAASFYGRLFGWRAARSNENGDYYLFYLDGKPVAGMSAMDNKDAAAPESLWLATISVSDLVQSVTAVTTHGGQLLQGPLDAVGRGRMALVSDPANAPFILLAAGGRGPGGGKSSPGQWLWVDLVSLDGNRAQTFYTALFGYTDTPVEDGEGHRYRILKREGRPVAGLVELQWDGLEDNWLPYFKVADVDRSIETAREMGGKLILKSGNVAILADSTGAAFGIQTSR